jgi:hypothetical protein
MHALNVLEDARNGKHKKLVEWLQLCDSVDIPEFYRVEAFIAQAEAHYSSQAFWNYLEGEIKKLKEVGQINASEPVKVAGKLKRSGLAVEQAERFLKISGRIAAEAIKKRNDTLEKVK